MSGAGSRSGGQRSEGWKRVRGTVLHIPVVHGSHAVWQGPRSTETRTHRWWLYLRPLDVADISNFIKHVEFVLHESFDPPVRKVSDMPYEINEYGWGEFDAVIRVYFKDPMEKAVEFFHPLKLFAGPGMELTRSPVVSEFYDEIVFQDPSERLLEMLRSTPHGPGIKVKISMLAPYFRDFSTCESNDLKRIEEARKTILDESRKKQERYEALETERAALTKEIETLESGLGGQSDG